MRVAPALSCLLLNLCVLVAPVSHVHAHIAHAEDHAQIHGGHTHDFDHHHSDSLQHDHGDHDHGDVVYLDAGTAPGLTAKQVATTLTQWLPLLYIVGLVPLPPPMDGELLRPPRLRTRIASQFPPWPPPLRGPPPST